MLWGSNGCEYPYGLVSELNFTLVIEDFSIESLYLSLSLVVSLAVFGNTAVIIVLFSHQSEFTVPKFLMLNLAIADLCMGLYLMLVAIQDLRSMGEYFNYAFVWQYGKDSIFYKI